MMMQRLLLAAILILTGIGATCQTQTQIGSTANPVIGLIVTGVSSPILTAILGAPPVSVQCLTKLQDGSQNVPAALALWTSSNLSVATVAASLNGIGIVTLVGSGTTTLSCAMGGLTGSASFVVTAQPTITAPSCSSPPCSLPNGVNLAAYSFMMTAAGGVSPYTWTCPSTCNMPGWMSLNSSTGILSGTAAAGTSTFTVQVCDNSSPTPFCTAMAITLTVGTSGGCGPPTYSCSRTDLAAIPYAASLVPPKMGPNNCTAGSLNACGNLTGAGTVVVDPFFGNPVMRVTDNTTGLGSQLNVTSVTDGEGSGDEQHFSCDDSMILVTNTNNWSFPMNFFGMSSAPTKMYTTSYGNNGFAISGSAGAWGHSCPTNAHK
jgi:hypothetical protein